MTNPNGSSFTQLMEFLLEPKSITSCESLQATTKHLQGEGVGADQKPVILWYPKFCQRKWCDTQQITKNPLVLNHDCYNRRPIIYEKIPSKSTGKDPFLKKFVHIKQLSKVKKNCQSVPAQEQNLIWMGTMTIKNMLKNDDIWDLMQIVSTNK